MHISLAAEKLFNIGWLPISNALLTSWCVIVFLLILSILATRKISLVPKGLQNIFEAMIEFLFNLIKDILGSEKQTYRLFPWMATFFIFILFINWVGLLPGVGSIGFTEGEYLTPLFRAGSADLSTTLALAVISVLGAQVVGIAALGVIKYGKKYLNFKGPLQFFVGILELLGEVTKIVSFSFRLFGNIFAGEVLLTVMTVLVPYILPIPFYGLEIFVGAIQAFIFMMLTLVFWKMATMEMSH